MAQDRESIEEAMLFMAQRLCRETSRHCKLSLLAKFAPVLPSSVEDRFVKERQDFVWKFRAMGTSTRKSSRNKTSNTDPKAMDIDAGNQVRLPFRLSASLQAATLHFSSDACYKCHLQMLIISWRLHIYLGILA